MLEVHGEPRLLKRPFPAYRKFLVASLLHDDEEEASVELVEYPPDVLRHRVCLSPDLKKVDDVKPVGVDMIFKLLGLFHPRYLFPLCHAEG
ncbi:MAG: hypothetical protein A4E63_01742 [Syntrophorhabdus sp. PtaU1.Bin050]|nr:MAG: hypothetical protein A4E63_01742 [Syntrophorhabdus sp. PtaU1.Bin050]